MCISLAYSQVKQNQQAQYNLQAHWAKSYKNELKKFYIDPSPRRKHFRHRSIDRQEWERKLCITATKKQAQRSQD